MATVSVTINDRAYELACDDGQEAHVTALATYADARARQLTKAVGPVGESMLLAMLCLLLADEVSEARAALEDGSSNADPAGTDFILARGIEALADRIDSIAKHLEKA